jgi:hypothetical protein
MGVHVMHQFPSPIRVHTPHGAGQAILVIDYGLNVNSVWFVRLSGGHLKHYYSDDIRIYDNPMNGEGYDVDIPEGWKL